MIEKAFETLEIKKEIAIGKILSLENINVDEYLRAEGEDWLIGKPINEEKLREAAIKEIDINYITLKRYLEELKECGFDIEDDLSTIEKMYYEKGKEHYRFLMNHVCYHFAEIKNIPVRLEGGDYCPSWDKTHVQIYSEVIK